jgi:hypothetical protein
MAGAVNVAKPENYLIYKMKIDSIIRQINENLYDQVSFPITT